MGYRSVYHHVTGEAYGQEMTPTYDHQRNRGTPFHIDVMFCSTDLLGAVDGFEIGTYHD